MEEMIRIFKRVIDISMPIFYDMPVYKGKVEKRPQLQIEADYRTGKVYESRILMNLHTGTHLDRTLHMMEQGNTIETLEVSELCTMCKVIDLQDVNNGITAKDLENREIEKGDFVLLKTKNSFRDILEKDFIYLEKTGAEYLVDKDISGVGIDALGIERSQSEHETHHQLMKKGIHILEGLRLKEVVEGQYFMVAVPINIVGAEAAPVRAILFQVE